MWIILGFPLWLCWLMLTVVWWMLKGAWLLFVWGYRALANCQQTLLSAYDFFPEHRPGRHPQRPTGRR